MFDVSIKDHTIDWITIWNVIGTISAESNRDLEQVTLRVRSRDQTMMEESWNVLYRDVLRETYTVLTKLGSRGHFKHFTLFFGSQGEHMELFPHKLDHLILTGRE